MITDEKKEELKSTLTAYVLSITKPDRRAGKNMYICPLCGSGSEGGRNHDGAFSITKDGLGWKCFSCNKSGDVFNLISEVEGIVGFTEQAERAAQFDGVAIPDEFRAKEAQPVKGLYKEYIASCKEAAKKTDYYQRRGFDQETIDRFSLGYDEAAGVIVIPYDKEGSYYITRSVEGKTFRKPKTDEAGVEPIYNKAALYSEKPCFVCESPLDAISIMQAYEGCNAIALGGTGHMKLLKEIKQHKPACTLILSLDADEEGKKAQDSVAKDLGAWEIPFTVANYAIDAYPEEARKDANDFLRGNADQLKRDIIVSIGEVERLQNAAVAELLEAHKASTAAARLSGFLDGIKDSVNTTYIPTGFSELDKALDGGLFSGLYILGAISSLGKTTFLLQIAEQIAAAGNDVIYISLEMAASELMSKTISRYTYELSQYRHMDSKYAKTARGITTGSRYQNYNETEKALIEDAIAKYRSYAEHLYIYEGIGDIGVEEIKKYVEEHIKLTGNKPTIFVDYLQILAPNDVRASDKQNTDKAVLELKRLSRDYKIPVLAISSFNRDNYNTEVNLTAFKESGSVEYGSDVLIALQPQGMKPGYTKTEQKDNAALVKRCKASDVREVEAVILKNRNGKTGTKLGFDYYTLFNAYKQDLGFKPIEENNGPINEDDIVPFGSDY